MLPGVPIFQSAIADFHQARTRAALQSIIARLTGKSIELLSYDEVYKKLRPTGSSDRGLRDIPLDAIVGSVGRYTDFTRTFLPRKNSDEQRWAKVKVAAGSDSVNALPPIEVYQIGSAYFVKDGNHRVSIARRQGLSHIAAYVTELRTRVPLTPDVQPDDLIIKAEYAAFLEYSQLDELRPGADLNVSVPGQYSRLEDHIEAYRYLKEAGLDRELPYAEAVCSWYDDVYLPVMQAIREQGILRYFEGRTETDLYLWISEHRVAFQRELGWSLAPEAAATKLAAQIKHRPDLRIGKTLNLTLPDVMKNPRSTGQWRLDKLVDRYTDRLFGDILVPLRGDAVSWCALDQALHLAQREQSRVHGLHVVASEAGKNSSEAQALRAEFERRLDRAGIAGSLGIEVGEITPRICERAIVTDLVILNLAHPPAPGLAARLGSKIQTILRHCARPVLFVPCTASWLNRAVLAYDGSAKSREALFVAAYLAEHIKIPLVVVSVTESNRVTSQTVEYARQYLEVHEVTATFVEASGPVTETILKTVDDYNGDLLIMGGHGHTPVLEAVLGSSVDAVLRDSSWPVLVCH